MGRSYTIFLDNEGEYYFYPSSYYVEENQLVDAASYTVSLEQDGVSYQQAFARELSTWNLDLDIPVSSAQKTLQLAFVIDTTWSMGDQINKIKETIQSVVGQVKEGNASLSIEYGLVAYKDKHDQYLTSAYQFTSDLDAYQERLDGLSAWGGGDYPEDINSWLEEAMEFLNRSDDASTWRLAFLVADAPPHMDYNQTYDYRVALLRAVEQWVKIYPVASSGLDNTVGELIFRQIALITNASYVFITKGASGKTDYHVDEQSYSVASLDDLLVDIILREVN